MSGTESGTRMYPQVFLGRVFWCSQENQEDILI